VKANPWTRVEKLTAAGIAVSIVAAILALVNPEVREFMGLDFEYSTKPQQFLPTRLSASSPHDSIRKSSPHAALSAEPVRPAGSILFAPRIDIPTDSQPVGITVADFDGDGLLDLAVAIYSSDFVSIFRNLGSTGAPAFGNSMQLSVGVGPEGVTASDLDCDGRPDLVSANAGADTVSVMRNLSVPGSIEFEQASSLNLPTPHRVAIEDIDRDGMPDIIVTSNSARTIGVFRHSHPSGQVVFDAPVYLAAPDFLNYLAVADLDEDGDLDLLVPLTDSHRLAIYQNLSTPGIVRFQKPLFLGTGALPDSVGTVPLGGGTSPAVVVGSRGVAGISIYVKSGTGFAARASVSTGNNPSAIASGDLDRDGRFDLVVANAASSTITVLRNVTENEDFSLLAQEPALRTGGVPLDLVLEDLDSDGFLDIATTNHQGAGISIFMNMSK